MAGDGHVWYVLGGSCSCPHRLPAQPQEVRRLTGLVVLVPQLLPLWSALQVGVLAGCLADGAAGVVGLVGRIGGVPVNFW